MPLLGIKCKKGNMTFKDCIDCAECTPRFLTKTLQNINEKDYHQGEVITATSLLGCMRETWIQRTQDYYATRDQCYPAWRGTMAHTIFETTDLPNWESERRYERDLKGITITGQLDGLCTLKVKHGIIYDIKTMKDTGLQYVAKTGPKEDHVWQASIYRWLVPVEITGAVITYLGMGNFVVTGATNDLITYLKNKPSKSEKFHISNVVETGKVNVRTQKEFIVSYDTPPVVLKSIKETEEFMYPRALTLVDSFKNNTPPPKCDDEMQAWKCDKWCPVRHICDEIETNRRNKCTKKKTDKVK